MVKAGFVNLTGGVTWSSAQTFDKQESYSLQRTLKTLDESQEEEGSTTHVDMQ